MAEKEALNSDTGHKDEEHQQDMGYGQPPPYSQTAYTAPSNTAGAPYTPALNTGAPNTGAPYAPAHYTGAPNAGYQYPGAPYTTGGYSQQHQSASTIVVQQPTQTTVVTTQIPDNMGLAIFACLCCFWPLGLFAILRANESQNALGRGDMEAARKNSSDARQFSLISIGIGVGEIVVVIIIFIVMIVINSG